ncbi:unnamed protein product [Psylliodes chrysocephalus]|uniref:Uncharacterized protein n=1 Tax=Psylliodes chrysocephalus TaxID=3402493 RepID=A0A9P0CHZ1_9CUCU|nr:unnamed protein product [Psylliodes chrysocephala]
MRDPFEFNWKLATTFQGKSLPGNLAKNLINILQQHFGVFLIKISNLLDKWPEAGFMYDHVREFENRFNLSQSAIIDKNTEFENQPNLSQSAITNVNTGCNSNAACVNCTMKSKIFLERKRSKECLEKQAKKMMKLSNEKFSEVDVGRTVRVPIPDVDRARCAPRSGF